MNFQRLLTELDNCPDTVADEYVGWVVNTVSQWATVNGHPELVREMTDAASRLEARRYLAQCIAATRGDGPPPVLTPPEVAKQLGVRPDRVLSWIKSGQLKASNLATGVRPRYRVTPQDVAAFLEKRQPEPKQPRPKRRRPDKPKRY